MDNLEEYLLSDGTSGVLADIALCEWQRIIPQPGRVYRARPVPECTACTELAAAY